MGNKQRMSFLQSRQALQQTVKEASHKK